ncbi:unnamed protein product [Spirodela intermedia]|uniref:Uncharacterized protein n=1 Tax=Spirodela intermedia TaxID=51605 RepID=A0A7I8JM23_SPIIN|nr:unnamed protein product [Spirodela intermedia]CAA6670623.1 unnamed protein product [Spirodela intermedia]
MPFSDKKFLIVPYINSMGLQDGRKFHVGDCALFQAGNSPPFIGIICWFTPGSADYPQLGVNWLYRPSDVKLAKGILVEAAPNEVFYSFHKDEISAASLLHPCKVAFLCKGVELPSGISSFVCWRVYDTTNKCLWWLTDKDYVDPSFAGTAGGSKSAIDRTRQEMHAALQSGGRSSKQLSGHLSAQQLKPSSDSGQNSSNTLSSQVKGKKRALEKADQGSESMKRERHSKVDDGDSGSFRPDSSIKAEIGKITDKGGLMNNDAVEKLVQLMQLDRGERKIDVGGRVLLADVITATDRNDCLNRFVQLRGIPILDDWLQEAHKGKNGDGSSPRGADKSVEELLLALLRALDKLPVNLNALQACQIGKSVNHLRSHKNVEIQKKAKGLVDTWKKRVDAEMTKIEMAKLNDAKPVGSTQGVSWPGKPGFSEVSLGGNRRAASTEVIAKSSINQPSSCKSLPSKSSHGDSVAKSNSPSAGSLKLSSTLATLVTTGSKDSHIKAGGSNAAAEQPLTAVKEEKSCSSSQSQSNSQSCSNDHGKAAGSLKEDVRSSAAGSTNTSKTTGSSSRHRRSSNGYGGSGSSAVQKDVGFGKSSSSTRSTTPEKVLQAGSATGKLADTPAADNGNGHILTVKLSNPGRSPSWSASGGSLEDPSARRSRPSSPGLSVKNEHVDHKTKSKSDSCQATNISAEVKTESWQSNDVKGAVGYDHGSGGTEPFHWLEPKSGKSLESVSITMNDLSENCTRHGPGESGAKTPDIETEIKSKVSLEDVMTQIPGLPEHTANIDSKKQEPSAGSLETQDDVKPAGSKSSDCPVSAAASSSKNASPSVTPANEPCDGASDGLADMKEDLHVIDPANQLQRKGRASEQVSDGSPGFKRKAGGSSEGKHVDCHQEIDGPDTDHTDADSGTCARESVMETSPFVPDKKSEVVDESKHEKCNDVEMKSQSEHSHDERKDHTNLAAPLQLDGACSSVHSTCNGSEEDSPNEPETRLVCEVNFQGIL